MNVWRQLIYYCSRQELKHVATQDCGCTLRPVVIHLTHSNFMLAESENNHHQMTTTSKKIEIYLKNNAYKYWGTSTKQQPLKEAFHNTISSAYSPASIQFIPVYTQSWVLNTKLKCQLNAPEAHWNTFRINTTMNRNTMIIIETIHKCMT